MFVNYENLHDTVNDVNIEAAVVTSFLYDTEAAVDSNGDAVIAIRIPKAHRRTIFQILGKNSSDLSLMAVALPIHNGEETYPPWIRRGHASRMLDALLLAIHDSLWECGDGEENAA